MFFAFREAGGAFQKLILMESKAQLPCFPVFFPLSPSLSPLCLSQLLTLKQGHFTDKRGETFPKVACSVASGPELAYVGLFLVLSSNTALTLALQTHCCRLLGKRNRPPQSPMPALLFFARCVELVKCG